MTDGCPGRTLQSPPRHLAAPAVTSGAPCLRDSSGISRGRALDRPARLRPQAADLEGARSKIARTPWRAWRHPSASSEIGRYACSAGPQDVSHGTAHPIESRPQAGRLRLRRLPPPPRQARRQLLGNRLASPPAAGDPAATASRRATSSSWRCSACRPRWSAPCVARPAGVATRRRSRTRRGPTASSARQRPSVGFWPVGQTPHLAGHGLHLRHRLGHRASHRGNGRGEASRPDQLGGHPCARRRRARWPVGQPCFTPVYQLDAGRRLLRVGEELKTETLESFFKWFATKRTGQALHMLDCFHVAGKLGDDRQGAHCRDPRVDPVRQAAAPHAQPLAAEAPPGRPPNRTLQHCSNTYSAGTCQLLRAVVRYLRSGHGGGDFSFRASIL